MQIVRFKAGGKTRYGVLEGASIEVRIEGIGSLKNTGVKL